MFFVVLAFAVVLIMIVGIYFLAVVHPETREQRKLQKRLRSTTREDRARRLGVLKEVERLSSVDGMESLLARFAKPLAPIRRLIEQSGIRMTLGTFVLATGFAALLLFILAVNFTGSVLFGITAGVCGAMLPYLWVRRARTNRMLKFEELFPEAIDLIARALRAGHAFPTGLNMVADELPDPIGSEFRLLFERQNFGMPMADALRSFADRVPVLDAKFFATAVLTQREAGGNLAEVLDNLAEIIRERFKVKRQVRVISAHGRLTGWVLVGIPPALAFGFFLINPDHLNTLLDDTIGMQMLTGGLILQVVGTLIVRRIIDIEF